MVMGDDNQIGGYAHSGKESGREGHAAVQSPAFSWVLSLINTWGDEMKRVTAVCSSRVRTASPRGWGGDAHFWVRGDYSAPAGFPQNQG